MSEYTSINQPSALLPVEGGTLRVENWHGTILEGVALYPFGKDGFDRRRAVLALGMAKEEIAHLGWAPSDFCNGHYLVFSVGPIASIEELLKAERKGYAVVHVVERDDTFEFMAACFPMSEDSYVACPWAEKNHGMSCGRADGPCDEGEDNADPCCYCCFPAQE